VNKRCAWVPEKDELYQKYHDTEWGLPVYSDNKIFEFLVLESAQAGLSWIIVLRKRENYRKAFADFDPEKVSRFGDKEIDELLLNPGIIRNKAKILATINNAKLFVEVQKEFGTFSKYIWGYTNGKPIVNKWAEIKQIPAKTPLAEQISKDMKKEDLNS
jgi:DNA-3-methyladenine glycosylase I